MPRLSSGLRCMWLVLFRARQPKILTKLPMELLLRIASYLPLPSQVCLALSCKGLYRILKAVLAAEELRFPRVSPRKPAFPGDRYYLTRPYCLRMELLLLLEDGYWACCGCCQKLHPRKEFGRPSLAVFPLRRICTSGAGLVDLCPCITLTLRNRKNIVEYLMGRGKQNIDLKFKGCLKDSCNDKGERCLSHECNIYSTVKVDIVLSLTRGDRLIACNRYELPSAALAPGMESVYCCRHYYLWDYVYRMLRYSPVQRCNRCCTKMVRRINLSTPDSTVVILTRDLGRGLWPTDWESDIFTLWPPQVRLLTDYVPIPHPPWKTIDPNTWGPGASLVSDTY